MNQQEKLQYFIAKVLPVAKELRARFESDGLGGGEQADFMMGLAAAACIAMGVDEQWAHDQLKESWAEIDKAFGALIRAQATKPPPVAAE